MIVRKTIGDQVFDHVVEQIKNEELKPGQQLKDERSLAVELGVSRVPVREAIKSLRNVGILTARQGEGTFVNTDASDVMKKAMDLYMTLNHTTLYEFAEVRKIMESESCKLACANGTDEELEEIVAISKKRTEIAKEEMSDKEKHEILDKYDCNFHMAIARATHNTVFGNFLESISETMKMHQHGAAKQVGMLDRTNQLHNKIAKAIKERNGERASKYMIEHIQDVENAMKS